MFIISFVFIASGIVVELTVGSVLLMRCYVFLAPYIATVISITIVKRPPIAVLNISYPLSVKVGMLRPNMSI